MEHEEIRRYKYMHSGDCYLYIIDCKCGKECGGWTPDDAEKDFANHLERVGLSNEGGD